MYYSFLPPVIFSFFSLIFFFFRFLGTLSYILNIVCSSFNFALFVLACKCKLVTFASVCSLSSVGLLLFRHRLVYISGYPFFFFFFFTCTVRLFPLIATSEGRAPLFAQVLLSLSLSPLDTVQFPSDQSSSVQTQKSTNRCPELQDNDATRFSGSIVALITTYNRASSLITVSGIITSSSPVFGAASLASTAARRRPPPSIVPGSLPPAATTPPFVSQRSSCFVLPTLAPTRPARWWKKKNSKLRG